MNAVQRLDEYLQALRHRLRTHIYVRGAALATAGVTVLAASFVWWWEYSGFASGIAVTGRVAIAVLLATIALACLWWPLRRLRRDEGAYIFERKLPQEQGRLATYLDARRRVDAADSPLIELLAEDAARIASTTPVDSIVSRRRVGAMALVAMLAVGALLALLTVAPGHWGYGMRHLLLGAEVPREVVPIRKILVTPGNATVRRNGDLAIRATVEGFRPDDATVFVRFADQTEWERAPMQRNGEAPSFDFKLYALRSPLSYYVAAGGTRSAEHQVTLADLPQIERVRLTYHYPQWTGLAPEIDENARDIRAVAGTKVTVEVHSDAPLEEPVLMHDGEVRALEARDGANAGTLPVERPGRYQIAARVAGERVLLSDEYAIEIVPDEKPVVQIDKPGRDWRATNIEEVPVRVQAHDDFRLQQVELRYSVNGGDWRSLPLDRNVKQTRESTLLELEKLGAEQAAVSGSPLLVPGDLVSYYAVAKDHKRSVQSDLFMVQVQPFERRFLQQNASGGGGGMGDEQGAISERQREILLATWNLQRSESTNRRSREQLEDNARMLSDMQATLAQQSRTLAARTRARAQVEADERIKIFVESLERAAVAMDPAAKHLSAFDLDKAVPVEQQALQQLLRAEAAFREVQVSMQSESGGEGAQSARDFSEMFELEMDVEKSQYESESQLSEQNVDKEMEEALRKLKELAERQEQLAQEANRNQTLTPEQRWRQEQLRREAEDLRRRIAAMNGQQQSQSESSQGSQSQGSSQSDGSSEPNDSRQASNSNSSSSQNALQSLDQALAEMQAANSQQREEGEQQASSAQQASRSLQQAVKQLDRPRASGLGEALEDLSQRANRLANEQRNVENELYESLRAAAEAKSLRSRPGAIDPQRAQSLVENKQKMAEELGELQKDLRSTVHKHRAAEEQSRQRLAEIVNDVESSDLMYRMRRSAAEIYYGRARDAAAREGIITESLQGLENDLREAAAQAGREGTQSPGTDSSTDRLLAEVAELRRRVEQRERLAALGAQSGESRSGESQSGRESQSGESRNTESRNSDSLGRESQEESNGAERSQQRSQQSAQQGAQQSARGGASATTGNEGLSSWDPAMPNMREGQLDAPGADSFARQSMSIADRAQRMRARTSSRELTAAELASLREMARELRQLAGDPLAAESSSMKQAVAQLELTALAAIANRMRTDAARTSVPVGESPQYREAVAEYYRRLGGS